MTVPHCARPEGEAIGRLGALDRGLRSATRTLATIGLLLLFANAMAVVADVTLRAALASPIDRLSDVSSVIFIIAAACCVPAATAARRHITIRAFGGRMGPRLTAAIEALAAAIATAIFAMITWQVGRYVGEVSRTGQTLSQIAVPVAPIWLFVTACLALTTACQLVALVDEARRMLRRAAPPTSARSDDAGLL